MSVLRKATPERLSAAVVALRYPLAALGICLACLAVYLRPDPPEVTARANHH